MHNPRLLYASVSRENVEGAKQVGYRDLQPFLGSVCCDQLVSTGYFICTVHEIGFRAIPSKSQTVLVVVGCSFCRAHVCDRLPCLRSRTQFKVEPCQDGLIRARVRVFRKTNPEAFQMEVMAVFPVDGSDLRSRGGGHFFGVVEKSFSIHYW